MGTCRFALVVIALAACGDDSGSARVDGAVDSPIENGDGGDAMMQVACGYTEQQDATNFEVVASETTMLTLGTAAIAICGTLNTGHYNASTDLIDADGFKFSTSAESDVILHLTGTGLNTPDRTIVQILPQTGNAVFGFGVVEGDHATMIRHLPAGNYVAAVYALDTVATSVAIDYKVTIGIDTARCATKTGTADHAEGTDNGANDVVDYASVRNPESKLTAVTTDAPEASGITVAPATSYLVTGTSASVTSTDDYLDHDTFAFITGATTNQMSVRLNWPGTNVDLDYRIYPMSTVDPESVAGGLDTPQMEDEYETFAVKPNTTYWLWIAAEDSSTGGVPVNYSATLCGETFTP